MKVYDRRMVRVAILVLVVGCGRSPAKPDASARDTALATDTAPDPVTDTTVAPDVLLDAPPLVDATATSSGTLQVRVTLGITISPNFPLAGGVQVFVRTLTDVAVDDATITLTKDGVDVPVTKDANNPSSYSVFWGDDSQLYKIAIVRGTDFFSVDALVQPSKPIVTLTPDQPVLNTGATVSYTHPNDLTTNGYASVAGANGSTYIGDANGPDSGSFAIPATAFPSSGTYEVQITRSQLKTPDAHSFIEVDTVTDLPRTIP